MSMFKRDDDDFWEEAVKLFICGVFLMLAFWLTGCVAVESKPDRSDMTDMGEG